MSFKAFCSASLMPLLLAWAPSAVAATYYVAPNGNDANPGTEAQPWATLRKAAASVEPGDVVRIKAGVYHEPGGWQVRRAGTPEKPIIYQAYGHGEVRITPSWVIPSEGWRRVKGAIYATTVNQRVAYVFENANPLHPPGDRAKIYSVDDLFPNSFYVEGNTLYVWLEDGSDPRQSIMRATAAHAVELRNCHYTIFDGLTVEFAYNGFKDQAETHHITYRNCTIRSIGSQGIQPVPRDAIIERNLFQKIGSNKWQHGIYGSQPGTIIRYNIFEEIAGAGIHQYHEGDPPAGGRCQFYGNLFRKPRKLTMRPTPSGNPYYVEIIAWGEGSNWIYNNLFFGEGKRGGISLNSPNNQVYHNTFVGSAYAVALYAGKPGNRVMNNIFQDATRAFFLWPANALPQTVDHNLYYNATAPIRWEWNGNTYESFAAYQQASGEVHSRYANPRLVSATDGRLQPDSPAIDAGVVVEGIVTDFEGTPRPQGKAPDLGAYEAKSAASSESTSSRKSR